MGYREAVVLETEEVLPQWLDGAKKSLVVRRLGADLKTVGRDVKAAEEFRLVEGAGKDARIDERLAGVVTSLDRLTGRPHGESSALCEQPRARITELLGPRLKLPNAQAARAQRHQDPDDDPPRPEVLA